MILDKKKIKVKNSQSIIAFETEGGGGWEKWDRYLTIEGKKAYHIGNVCGTCNFFFERMEGANQSVSPKEVIDRLNSNVNSFDADFLVTLQKIFPNGEYLVMITEVQPKLVVPGDNHDYFSNEEVDLWGIDGFWGMPHFPKQNITALKLKNYLKKEVFLNF